MIQYTINNCNESITITSDLISDWAAQTPTYTDTLEVVVTLNCGSSYTIDSSEIDLPEEELVITPAMLGMNDTISDGIIHILITETAIDGSGFSTEEACILMDCLLKCCMASYIADNLTTDVVGYYLAIQWAVECEDCGCDEACILYDKLIEIVNNNGSTNSCGCT